MAPLSDSFKAKLSKVLTFTLQTAVLSVVIVGGGYGIMKATVPSEEQMIARMGNIDKDKMTEDQKNARLIVEAIMENARSDRPVWDIQPDHLKDKLPKPRS
ncbi:hypothetical protein BC831DRAFT_289725 [Entophlyctis helioformis]|nr:hypothetical protein BC831DRAFT_289725 [Entophlyctis helioformis]